MALQRPPCAAVARFTEAELRAATDDLSFSRRALGSPHGFISYATRLRGRDVAVSQARLGSVAGEGPDSSATCRHRVSVCV